MTIWRLPVFGPTEWIIRIGFVLVGINPTYERVSLLSNLLIVVYRTKVGAKICVCYKSQLVGKNSTDIRIALLGDWPPMVDRIRDRILHVDNSQVHSSVHSCYFMYHVHRCTIVRLKYKEEQYNMTLSLQYKLPLRTGVWQALHWPKEPVNPGTQARLFIRNYIPCTMYKKSYTMFPDFGNEYSLVILLKGFFFLQIRWRGTIAPFHAYWRYLWSFIHVKTPLNQKPFVQKNYL